MRNRWSPRDTPFEVAHVTAYRVHERVAERYRVQGRVLLAGDAAHINNPLGGMGMNGGIHDAMNLAEKLNRGVARRRALELMQRYERQRRKVAIETVQAQALRNRQILNDHRPGKNAAPTTTTCAAPPTTRNCNTSVFIHALVDDPVVARPRAGLA